MSIKTDKDLECVRFQWRLAVKFASQKKWLESNQRLEYLQSTRQYYTSSEDVDSKVVCVGDYPLSDYGISNKAVAGLIEFVNFKLAKSFLYLYKKYESEDTSLLRHHIKMSGRPLDFYGVTEQELDQRDLQVESDFQSFLNS